MLMSHDVKHCSHLKLTLCFSFNCASGHCCSRNVSGVAALHDHAAQELRSYIGAIPMTAGRQSECEFDGWMDGCMDGWMDGLMDG